VNFKNLMICAQAKIDIANKGSEFRNEGSRSSTEMKSERLDSVLAELKAKVSDSTEAVEKTEVRVKRVKGIAWTKANFALASVFGDDKLMEVMIKYYDRLCASLYTLSADTGAGVLVRCTPETDWFFVAHVLLRAADFIVKANDVTTKSRSWLKTEFVYQTSAPLLLSAGIVFVNDCVIQVLTDTVEHHLEERLASTRADLLLQQTETARLQSDFSRYRIDAEANAARLTEKHIQEKADQKTQHRKNVKLMRDALALAAAEALSLENHLKKCLASTRDDLLLQEAETACLESDFSRYRIEAEANAARLAKKHIQEKADQKAQHRKNLKHIEALKAMAEKSTAAYTARLESEVAQHTDETTCTVCLENPRSIVVMPCNHLCMCTECAKRVMTTSPLCPICRTPASKTIRVY
jgi:predicted GIY-YIG superfamily endonuclease